MQNSKFINKILTVTDDYQKKVEPLVYSLPIKDRKLEERSYLRFEFFESSRELPHVRYLLFYEDPEIRESRKAMHAKYQPISRNSTLLAYTGAESRVFSITFKMTLPHIFATGNSLFFDKKSGLISKEEKRKQFFKANQNEADPQFKALRGSSKDHDLYFLDFDQDYALDNPSPIGPTGTYVKSSQAKIQNDPRPLKNRAIDMIMYWTNLIRTSVLNNAKNPTMGPPIIRLNHGILYQDIPCVALDYKIDYDKVHGVDLQTLLPRVITFEINLQEIRVGDFRDFDVTHPIRRDNSVGWEVMIGNVNTIDPIRPDIGFQK